MLDRRKPPFRQPNVSVLLALSNDMSGMLRRNNIAVNIGQRKDVVAALKRSQIRERYLQPFTQNTVHEVPIQKECTGKKIINNKCSSMRVENIESDFLNRNSLYSHNNYSDSRFLKNQSSPPKRKPFQYSCREDGKCVTPESSDKASFPPALNANLPQNSQLCENISSGDNLSLKNSSVNFKRNTSNWLSNQCVSIEEDGSTLQPLKESSFENVIPMANKWGRRIGSSNLIKINLKTTKETLGKKTHVHQREKKRESTCLTVNHRSIDDAKSIIPSVGAVLKETSSTEIIPPSELHSTGIESSVKQSFSKELSVPDTICKDVKILGSCKKNIASHQTIDSPDLIIINLKTTEKTNERKSSGLRTIHPPQTETADKCASSTISHSGISDIKADVPKVIEIIDLFEPDEKEIIDLFEPDEKEIIDIFEWDETSVKTIAKQTFANEIPVVNRYQSVKNSGFCKKNVVSDQVRGSLNMGEINSKISKETIEKEKRSEECKIPAHQTAGTGKGVWRSMKPRCVTNIKTSAPTVGARMEKDNSVEKILPSELSTVNIEKPLASKNMGAVNVSSQSCVDFCDKPSVETVVSASQNTNVNTSLSYSYRGNGVSSKPDNENKINAVSACGKDNASKKCENISSNSANCFSDVTNSSCKESVENISNFLQNGPTRIINKINSIATDDPEISEKKKKIYELVKKAHERSNMKPWQWNEQTNLSSLSLSNKEVSKSSMNQANKSQETSSELPSGNVMNSSSLGRNNKHNEALSPASPEHCDGSPSQSSKNGGQYMVSEPRNSQNVANSPFPISTHHIVRDENYTYEQYMLDNCTPEDNSVSAEGPQIPPFNPPSMKNGKELLEQLQNSAKSKSAAVREKQEIDLVTKAHEKLYPSKKRISHVPDSSALNDDACFPGFGADLLPPLPGRVRSLSSKKNETFMKGVKSSKLEKSFDVVGKLSKEMDYTHDTTPKVEVTSNLSLVPITQPGKEQLAENESAAVISKRKVPFPPVKKPTPLLKKANKACQNIQRNIQSQKKQNAHLTKTDSDRTGQLIKKKNAKEEEETNTQKESEFVKSNLNEKQVFRRDSSENLLQSKNQCGTSGSKKGELSANKIDQRSKLQKRPSDTDKGNMCTNKGSEHRQRTSDTKKYGLAANETGEIKPSQKSAKSHEMQKTNIVNQSQNAVKEKSLQKQNDPESQRLYDLWNKQKEKKAVRKSFNSHNVKSKEQSLKLLAEKRVLKEESKRQKEEQRKIEEMEREQRRKEELEKEQRRKEELEREQKRKEELEREQRKKEDMEKEQKKSEKEQKRKQKMEREQKKKEEMEREQKRKEEMEKEQKRKEELENEKKRLEEMEKEMRSKQKRKKEEMKKKQKKKEEMEKKQKKVEVEENSKIKKICKQSEKAYIKQVQHGEQIRENKSKQMEEQYDVEEDDYPMEYSEESSSSETAVGNANQVCKRKYNRIISPSDSEYSDDDANKTVGSRVKGSKLSANKRLNTNKKLPLRIEKISVSDTIPGADITTTQSEDFFGTPPKLLKLTEKNLSKKRKISISSDEYFLLPRKQSRKKQTDCSIIVESEGTHTLSVQSPERTKSRTSPLTSCEVENPSGTGTSQKKKKQGRKGRRRKSKKAPVSKQSRKQNSETISNFSEDGTGQFCETEHVQKQSQSVREVDSCSLSDENEITQENMLDLQACDAGISLAPCDKSASMAPFELPSNISAEIDSFEHSAGDCMQEQPSGRIPMESYLPVAANTDHLVQGTYDDDDDDDDDIQVIGVYHRNQTTQNSTFDIPLAGTGENTVGDSCSVIQIADVWSMHNQNEDNCNNVTSCSTKPHLESSDVTQPSLTYSGSTLGNTPCSPSHSNASVCGLSNQFANRNVLHSVPSSSVPGSISQSSWTNYNSLSASARLEESAERFPNYDGVSSHTSISHNVSESTIRNDQMEPHYCNNQPMNFLPGDTATRCVVCDVVTASFCRFCFERCCSNTRFCFQTHVKKCRKSF